MISYISPKFSGFGFGVDYGFGEKTQNRASRNISVGGTYDNGPLSIGLGYDQQNNVSVTPTVIPAVPAVEQDLKTWQLGAAYNFGVAKLAAFYKQTKYEDVVGTDSDKLKTFNIGVSAPVGAAGEVKLAYNNYKLSGTDAKANQLSLGYVHSLSKRTAVYGTYAYLKNKDGAGFTLNGAFAAAGLNDGGKQHGLQVGVRHAF
jgi:predicted porin